MDVSQDKYSRPYCDNCKLIHPIGAVGRVTHCSKCGGLLKMKSFNPWPKAIGAVALIGAGLVTLLVAEIPIIWIGAFVWAIGLLVNGFRQWSKIKELDDPIRSQYIAPPNPVKKELKDDRRHVVVNCGACFHQYRVRRNQGVTRTRCPSCGREARVST